MLFPTFTFFTFFVIALALNWALKKTPLIWRLFLLASSYFFYAIWDWRFLILIAAISVINFYSASLIAKNKLPTLPGFVGRRKMILAGIVIVDVLVLVFFKYYGFFRESAEILLNQFGLQSDFLFLHVILPVGLSFYILRVISYSVDVFEQKIQPEKSFLDFAIYVAFFPQLLAGPIMRAGEFLPQLKNGGSKAIENLQENFALILSGLFKKLVIASYLTINIVDDVFLVPQNHSQLAVLLAIYAYSVVIYCDFSGYSDIATGVAGLMGFKSPLNFNAPYLANDFRDFWRRWHMTFSGWLKDYVYIPLGGSKKGELRTYLNSMLTMLVSGMWHGTGFHFIFWGALHGLGLAFSRFKLCFQVPEAGFMGKFEKVLSWFITFNFISFFWIFFRAENLNSAFDIIEQLFNWQAVSSPLSLYVVGLIIFSFLIFAFGRQIKILFVRIQEKLPFFAQVLVIAVLAVVIFKLGPDIVPPFIYFKF